MKMKLSMLPHTKSIIFLAGLSLASVSVITAWNGKHDDTEGSGWGEGFPTEWNDLRVADVHQWCYNSDNCYCFNPLQPEKRNVGNWLFEHQMNVERAKFAPNDVDVVFYGDSIIEGWGGTMLGKEEVYAPRGNAVFDSIFQKRNGGRYEGVPLGIAGDGSPHLLWRIMNGELPDNLQPKVIWILIGVNSLGGGKIGTAQLYCSPESVLMGIKRVVEEISQRRPQATIVVNGVLPRKEQNIRDFGTFMEGIQRVNIELRKYCNERGFHYYDPYRLFLGKKWRDMYRDTVHPSVKGYQLWGESIVEELGRLI